MPILEFDRKWAFTSTGSGGWERATWAQQITFVCESAAGSTGTVRLEHRRKGSTSVSLFDTAVVLDASTAVTKAFVGAYYEIRPRVTDMTSTGTITVQGIGN